MKENTKNKTSPKRGGWKLKGKKGTSEKLK
jgi:hypothetical protein